MCDIEVWDNRKKSGRLLEGSNSLYKFGYSEGCFGHVADFMRGERRR